MTIARKLFILTVLPALSILVFSLDHISYKNDSLKNQYSLIKSSNLLKVTSDLLYKLQYERGLSSFVINKEDEHFMKLLQNHTIETDIAIKNFLNIFKNLDDEHLSIVNVKLFNDVKDDFKSLAEIRIKIKNLQISSSAGFYFYTHINADLLEIINHIRLYSTHKEAFDNILALKEIIIFRELAGQERGLIPSLIKNNYLDSDMRLFYSLIEQEEIKTKEIKRTIHDSLLLSNLQSITKNKYIHINNIRALIKKKDANDINMTQWMSISTSRINDYYKLEQLLLDTVMKNMKDETDQIKNSLTVLIIFTFVTMFVLLFGAYLISKSIKKSLYALDSGISNFFDFLNFKTQNISVVETNSNDELNEMAKKINKQIALLQLNLDNDKHFIKETTKITNFMKNGNFSKHIFFDPSNPNLIKLKTVFNELIDLIVDKIKLQTLSLENLNHSLEDKVYNQTIELERQLQNVIKSRDDVLNAQKSKDDFLANMSHEIRTPLNAILGFVTILQKRVKDSTDKEYLQIISTSGNSLLNIINDILDFSKIQSGKFDINPREINPMLEFSNTTILFASKCYEKHIIYAVYIDPNLPKLINIDDTRVKQVLSNLLSNAIKFTPLDGNIKVSIFIKDSNLHVSVQDSGIGIAKENISKVFNAFEQADGSTTRKFGGTGLGLSISSRLAKLMDGTLTLSSTLGKGSIFTLTIPVDVLDNSPKNLLDIQKIKHYKFAILHTAHDNISTRLLIKYLHDLGISNLIELNDYTDIGYDILFFIPSDEYNEEIVEAGIPSIAMLRSNQVKLANIKHITSLYAPFAPTSVIQAIDDITDENIQDLYTKNVIEEDEEVQITYKGKVLVAEDNKTNQMLISLLLDDYTLEYKIANNGLEAVKIFKEENFDLVLMDENMPELNGLGAMKLIKQYEKQNSKTSTPIIALTAAVLQSDVERFLSEGMNGFVAKPIENKKLEDELDKFLTRV